MTNVSQQRGMPVDDKGSSSTVETKSEASVQLYYYDVSGVQQSDEGQPAGTIIVARLLNDNIKNKLGTMQATFEDTSLIFTSTALTTERKAIDTDIESFDGATASNRANAIVNQSINSEGNRGLLNGEYVVDYTKGLIYGKKADTSTTLTSATYIVNGLVVGSSTSDIETVGGQSVPTDDVAMIADPKFLPVGGEYRATPTSYTDGDATILQTDSEGSLRVTSTESAEIPQALGTDATGQDAYATILTPSSNKSHIQISLDGSNDAIVSVDAGTTDHIHMPANSIVSLDSFQVTSGVAIQAKNASAGNNYTNLNITIW